MAVIQSNGSHGHHKFILTVNEDSTNIANNTSTVSYSFVLTYIDKYYNWSGWGQKISDSINIAGETYSGYIPSYDGVTENVVLSSGTLPAITHNLNGTKEISMSFSVIDNANGYGSYGYYTCGNASATGIMTLTTIPRYAEILTAPNFNDEQTELTITYSNPLGNSVTSLEACIASADGMTIYVPYEPIVKTDSTHKFKLDENDLKVLRKAATATDRLQVRFYIKTVYNGVTNLDSLPREMSIINAKPILLPTAADTKTSTLALTGSGSRVIKGNNIISYAFNATPQKEATITKYSVECGSFKGTTATGTFENVESNVFTFTIEDSRGNILTKSVTLTLIDYNTPTCNQKADIELAGETGAKINLTISGKCFNGNFGAKANDITFGYRIKAGNGSYGDWVIVTDTPTFKDNTYSVNTVISGLSYDVDYTIQSRVCDLIIVIWSTEYPITLTPIFDWGKDDFKFNVPVYIQGDLVNDFVVEAGTDSMGSNGTWYWRKWKSGRADCYGKRNFGNMGFSTAYGSLYRSANLEQDLPNIFKQAPDYISIEVMSGSGGTWVLRGLDTTISATNTGSFSLCRPNTTTLNQVYLGFNIVGRWK